MAQPTYEESEAAAKALLDKYNEGTLTQDDTDMENLDDVGEIGSLTEAQAGEPAIETKGGDDATKKRDEPVTDDGGDPAGAGQETDGEEAAGDAGDAGEAGKGPEGDGTDTGADTSGDAEPVGDEKRVKDAQRKMHEATGRAARLQGELNEVLGRVAALEAGGARQPAAARVPEVDFETMTPEEIATTSEDYPGLAKVFAVIGGLQDQLSVANDKLADLDGEVRTTTATSSKNEWMAEIRKEHADVDAIQGSDPFTGWLEEQPDYIRQAVYESGTVRDMVTIIQNYKDDVGLEAPSAEETAKANAETKRQSKLEQARQVTTPSLRKPARQHRPEDGKAATMTQSEIKAFNADIQNRTPDEIAAFEARVDKAIAAGKVSPN